MTNTAYHRATLRDLKELFNSLTEEQLDQNFVLYDDPAERFFYPDGFIGTWDDIPTAKRTEAYNFLIRPGDPVFII